MEVADLNVSNRVTRFAIQTVRDTVVRTTVLKLATCYGTPVQSTLVRDTMVILGVKRS